jgi:signal transduction histidine kinase
MTATTDDEQLRAFEALARLVDAGVVILDRDAGPRFADAQALELLGCADAAELKSRWPVLRAELGIAQPGAAGGVARLTTEHRARGARRSLRLEVYPLGENAQGGYLVLLSDRRDGGMLETELLLANQMRSLPHLYRVLLHDLKAPLNAMQLTLELLGDPQASLPDAVREAKRQRYLAVLKEELMRLDRILQTVLAENEPIGAPSRAFDFREIVREVVTLLTPEARRRRVAIEAHVPDRVVELEGYRDRLRQALLNLGIGALEAMPDGGRLTLGLTADGERLRIACEDTGRGLAPEVLQEIHRVSLPPGKARANTALLAARLVAESHGGEMIVDSKTSGTVVTLALPLAGEQAG